MNDADLTVSVVFSCVSEASTAVCPIVPLVACMCVLKGSALFTDPTLILTVVQSTTGVSRGTGDHFFGGWFTTQLRRVWDRSRDRSHLGGWFKTQGYEPPVPTAVFFLVFLLKSVLFQLNELLARLLRARAMESGEQESTCDECVTSRCCIPGGGFLPLCVELVSLVHTPLSVAGTIT